MEPQINNKEVSTIYLTHNFYMLVFLPVVVPKKFLNQGRD